MLNDRPKKIPKGEFGETTRHRVTRICSAEARTKSGVQVRPRRFACWFGFGQVAPRMALVTDFRKYGQKQRGYPHPSRLRVQIPFNPPDPRLTWFSFENSAGAGHSSRRSRPDTTTEPSFTMTDPSTMTVAQLKEELKARGLDATGLKAALLARLQAALESAGDDAGDDAKSGASRTLPATRSSLETRPSGASSGRAGRWRRLRRARGPRSSTAAPESPARATRQSRK